MSPDGEDEETFGFGIDETEQYDQPMKFGAAIPSRSNASRTTRSRWPDPVPDFVGMGFVNVDNDEEGHGTVVYRTEMYGFEEHPTEPDIFRARFSSVDLSYPDDASPKLKALVGKRMVQHRFFRVDRRRMCMQLVGGIDLDSESDVPNSAGFAIVGEKFKDGSGLSVEGVRLEPIAIGPWKFNAIASHMNFQYVLNETSTVFRCVNFRDATTETVADFDIAGQVSFFFARPAMSTARNPVPKHLRGGTDLCADLILPVIDDTEQQCRALKKLFDGGIFRSPTATNKLPITVQVTTKSIARIETLEDQFGAEQQITVSAPISKIDAANFVAAVDKSTWAPSAFEMPRFVVINPAVSRSAAQCTVHYGPITVVRSSSDKVLAQQTTVVKGDRQETLELENYPFDCQRLALVYATEKRVSMGAMEVTVVQETSVVAPHASEWAGGRTPPFSACVFKIDEGVTQLGRWWLTTVVPVRRHYSVHIYRVIMVMVVFALASLFSFALDAEDAASRLSFVVTLMLTATAYSLVIASNIPKLGYLTFMDQYILLIFGYITAVLAELAVIQWYTLSEEIETYILYINFGALVAIHIVIAAYIKLHVLPAEEIAKLDHSDLPTIGALKE